MGDKSPGIRTPLKETNIVPNYCCRICRICVKISGRSKINVLGYDNKDFSQTLSSVLSADVHDSTGFQGKQLKRRILSRGPLVLVICFFMVARKPEKLLLIKISPVVSWLQRFVSKMAGGKNRAYYIVYFWASRSRRFAGMCPKIIILICILKIWLAFWFGGFISFFVEQRR